MTFVSGFVLSQSIYGPSLKIKPFFYQKLELFPSLIILHAFLPNEIDCKCILEVIKNKSGCKIEYHSTIGIFLFLTGLVWIIELNLKFDFQRVPDHEVRQLVFYFF